MKIVVALLFWVSFVVGGTLNDELFALANKQYEKANYDSAILNYQKIISNNGHDSRVYYNLGNTFYRKKSLGHAILNFEKARLLNPSDKDIQANLNFARTSTVDKIVPREKGFFEKVLLFLHNLMNVQAQSLAFIVLLFVMAGCFTLILVSRGMRREIASIVLIISLVIFVFLSLSLFIKIHDEKNTREGVVLSSSVTAVNEPDGSQVLFTVHEGAKFAVVRKVGGWYFASLDNGMAGWLKEADVGIIEIEE